MTRARTVATFVAATVGGLLVFWGLVLLWTVISPIEYGMLSVPLLVMLVGGYLLARRSARVLAAGLIFGAVLETLFFLYLFNTWGF